MDGKEQQLPEPGPDREGGWRPRRLHFHLGIWSVLAVGAVALFLALASMSLTGRSVTLPNWVAERVERELNDAMPQGALSLRRIEMGVTPKGRPRFRIVDVGLKDASGLDIAQLNAIEGGVRIAPLLRGEVVPRTAILTGAQITFRRLADGTFALQFGQGSEATGSLADMLDAVDVVFTDGMLADATRVEALGLNITLEDARSGRLWQVTDGRLRVDQTDRIVETSVAFDVFNQTDELAEVELALRTAKDDSAATLAVTFENAAAADIGAQSQALSFLKLVDAPVSGALRTTLGPDGAITDLAGTLEIEEGAIKPAPGAKPVGFGGAKGYLDYDPDSQALALRGLTFSSDLGEVSLEGRLYLTDYIDDWPQSVVGQFHVNHALFNTPKLFDEPVAIDDGYADVRLKLSPFSLDIGQAVLFRGDTRYMASGRITATKEAWDLALDIEVPELSVAELKTVWPKTLSPNPRKWVFRNAQAGTLYDVNMAVRGPDLKTAQALIGAKMRDGRVKVMKNLPAAEGVAGHMTLSQRRLVVAVTEGEMPAPDGSRMNVSGTHYTVPDVKVVYGPGIADVVMEGPAEGALALLDLPPFSVFKSTDFGPEIATGYVTAKGRVEFLQKPKLEMSDVDFNIAGTVRDVVSDGLIAGSVVRAERLDFTARPDAVEVTGAAKIGDVAARGTWHQPLRAEDMADGSVFEGSVALSMALVEEFNLGLSPSMISGEAPAAVRLAIVPGEPLRLTASSQLVGLGLAIPGTGWSKPARAAGDLQVAVTLGPQPVVDEITLSAPGLSAAGRITTRPGGLDAARFSRVRLGGWLDAPVTLTGRGAQPLAISVDGGRADLRAANFGTSGSSSSSGAPAPLDLRLNELVIAEGIVLQNFVGDFDLSGGLSGDFAAFVKDGAPITGIVGRTENGAAYQILSDRGGEVLRGMGVFAKARGGDLEVKLVPTGQPGTFEGSFTLDDTRLVDAPAMAELLSALSVVGLLDQLDGPGIRFTEVKGRFNLSPQRVTLYSSSAASASIGLSMDGYYNLDSGTMDMQGVLSPFFMINSLGRVVSARDGEGLVGFSFNLTGPGNDLNVMVNPLSVLTPGVLREIFRRQAPQQPVGE